MMTLCRKEVREHLRWALLAALGLALAQWYALTHQLSEGAIAYSYDTKGLGLCHTMFLSITTFGCPVVGMLIGLLQILPELSRDRWASLLHRPVSPAVIYRGKVCGGLILYMIGTVPPFLFSIWLVATPGHFALPFVPGTVLPGTADICTGAVYYFAALTTALQRDRWIGVRLLPLLAALHVSYFILSAHLFRVAIEAAVAMSLALFTFGWGLMLHATTVAARPWLARLAGLIAVFYGAQGLGDLGRSICNVIGPARDSRFVQYVFTDTGVPLRITYDNDVVSSVFDLAGHEPTDARFRPDQVRRHMTYLNQVCSNIGDAHGWHRRRYRTNYRDSDRYLTASTVYQLPRFEQWFHLTRQRSWICYQPFSKTAVARLDRAGFEPPGSPALPLGGGWNYTEVGNSVLLYSAAHVRLAALPKQEVTEVALPAGAHVNGVDTAFAQKGNGSITIIGAALDRALNVYDVKGAPVAILPYGRDVSRWGQVSLGVNGERDRFFVEYEPSAWLDEKTTHELPSFLEVRDAAGGLLRTDTLPLLPRNVQPPPWGDWIAHRSDGIAFFLGRLGYQKLGGASGSKRLAGDFARRVGSDRALTIEMAAIIAALGVLLAVATLTWALRAGLSRRRAIEWALFVGLVGLPGLFAFRLAQDWPQTVPCPGCGTPRPIEGARCPHCSADWPAVPLRGTEIFDTPATMPHVGALP